MKTMDYLVIGAGPAGGAAAMELARHTPFASVALVGAEAYTPYARPPLSKGVLACNAESEICPEPVFGEREELQAAGIRVFSSMRALHINRVAKYVEFDSGDSMGYGKLLIATGSSPRRLTVAGADLGGVFYLRTFDDARRLSEQLRLGGKVVVIGGGFIGLEVAASACRMGCSVTVIEAGPRLMARSVPEAVSLRFLKKFIHHGVAVRLGVGVDALMGDGRVRSVALSNGEHLDASAVVVGIGATPNDGIASRAGLNVRDGILTDGVGRSSDDSIYAVGDVARRRQGLNTHPDYAARLEAWEPAIEHAVATARAMLAMPVGSLKAPWVWSDQFDWNIQIAGHGELADELVVRESGDGEAMTALQLYQGQLLGLITLNNPRDMVIGRRALQGAARLDPARLADVAIPLKVALSAA